MQLPEQIKVGKSTARGKHSAAIRIIIGILLLLVGALIAIVVGVIGYIVGIFVVGEPLWGVGILVGVLFVLAGWKVIEGRKRVVLFLRKFGDSEASDLVRWAIRQARNRYRLVTLDDRKFEPKFADTDYRAFSLSILVPIVLLSFLVMAIALPLGGASSILAPGATNLLVLCAAAGPLIQAVVKLFGVGQWSRMAVDSQPNLLRLGKYIRTLQGWDLAPQASGSQMIVATVENHLWQHAVAELAREAAAVVIDVSTETESILWELKFATATCKQKTLVLQRSSDVADLALSDPSSELAEVLQSYDIVSYQIPCDGQQREVTASSVIERLGQITTS